MATTSVEAKNNVCVEEYLRLRKVWAKYVDGFVERAGTRPGRVIGLADPKPTVLTLRQWAETMVEADARGPRIFVDPAGTRWQVGIAAVEHRNMRWMWCRGATWTMTRPSSLTSQKVMASPRSHMPMT